MSTTLIAFMIIIGFVSLSTLFVFVIGPYLIRKIHEAVEQDEVEKRQEILNKFTTMTYGDESPEEVERMYKEVYYDKN